MNAQLVVANVSAVGTVLRLERDAYSMVKRLRRVVARLSVRSVCLFSLFPHLYKNPSRNHLLPIYFPSSSCAAPLQTTKNMVDSSVHAHAGILARTAHHKVATAKLLDCPAAVWTTAASRFLPVLHAVVFKSKPLCLEH